MDATETIKSTLSMMTVATRYGFVPNRGCYINCPFHTEKTPSLKLYDQPGRGFNCFSCGATGSVIDFVMKLFSINFSQAIRRLGTDFGIAVGGRPDYRESQRISKILSERNRQQREYDRLQAEWIKATNILHEKRPESIDEYLCTDKQFDSDWVDAIKSIPFLEFKLKQMEVEGLGRTTAPVHQR